MKEVLIKRELRKLNKIKGLPIYTPSSCSHLPELYLTSIPHKHPVSTSSTGRVTSSWMCRMTSPTCSVPFCLSHFNFTIADSNIICQFLCQETFFFFFFSLYDSTKLVCKLCDVYKCFLKFILYDF